MITRVGQLLELDRQPHGIAGRVLDPGQRQLAQPVERQPGADILGKW
jgi:hypothetical protein